MANAERGARVGVLLTNLGTPTGPTAPEVRRFLDEFLSDPRVVQAPRWLWLPLLRACILPLRAPRSARAYARIWTKRGAPLLAGTEDQRDALAAHLGAGHVVTIGMRYGEPSLASGLRRLVEAGVARVVVLPLYPQYSETTTGTTVARLEELERHGQVPVAWASVPSFPEDPGYLAALESRVREAVASKAVDRYVFSFHGLPERYVRRGDPYARECERTAEALAARLGLDRRAWTLGYQSRFGPERWLRPATADLLAEAAVRGARVAVVMPGFAVDCLETLEEIGIGLASEFRRAGGAELVVVPALQSHPLWIEALASLVQRAAG